MDTRVKDLHLPAIPETVPVNHLPVSARASPRSTSDSPAQATLPISPTSRLLKPTLSWQAKAGWIPEPPTSSGRKPTGTDVDAGSSHKQVLTIAVDARDQATAAASRLSPSPPSASWHSATDPQQTFGGATGSANNATVCTVPAQQPSNGLVVQEKADQLTGLLQDELAKRGKPGVTPWQQQRLQLRAVRGPSGSPAAKVGSPGNFRYSDASVDSLQQQRAKLKPVQTSKHAALPASVQQGSGAPPMVPVTRDAQLRGVSTASPPVAVTGIAPEVRSPPVAPAETAPAAVTQLGPQATASPASKLRSKYGQLTDLLQNTALQRGISLSQVPIPPTHKPGTGQQKRVSLEEVRTSFKSFTTASSVAASSKPAPLRRVSTGAITPAFLKEKHKQDKALLESLGVADAAAEVNSDAAADAAAPSWAPKQSGRTYLVDETPAVFTRGKGWNRPTGSSFDIKMQHVDTSDEVSSGADGNAADPDSTDAGQAIAHNAGQGVSSNAARISNTGSAVEQTGVNSIYKATSKGSSVQSIQVSHAKQLDAHLEQQSEYTGDPQAAVMKDPVPKLSKKQEALDDTQKLRLTSVTDDDGIKSSGVKVDIISAHKTTEKKVDAAGVSQQAGTAQNSTTSKVQPMQHKSFAHRFCCVCCSTKD